MVRTNFPLIFCFGSASSAWKMYVPTVRCDFCMSACVLILTRLQSFSLGMRKDRLISPLASVFGVPSGLSCVVTINSLVFPVQSGFSLDGRRYTISFSKNTFHHVSLPFLSPLS